MGLLRKAFCTPQSTLLQLHRLAFPFSGCTPYRLQCFSSMHGFLMPPSDRATSCTSVRGVDVYKGHINPLLSNGSAGIYNQMKSRGYATENNGSNTRRGNGAKGSGDGESWDFSSTEDKWEAFGAINDGGEIKGDENADWDASVVDEGDYWTMKAQTQGSGGNEFKDSTEDQWNSVEGYEPWTMEEKEASSKLQSEDSEASADAIKAAQEAQLQKEEEHLMSVLKGPERAFGDLISASGISEVQIESLIVMKDLEGVKGLPPLKEIEDARLAKTERKSVRGEIEQKRQEAIARARVRKVDSKGRAYGTGRRKCSIARVWIQPGNGKFVINEKSFDAYFKQLEHRTDLLSPFLITKTLGLWDIVSKVQGGGRTGQVGAIRLGISRALQNWEPGFRPYLKAAGLLTRDPRVVERKKPGKPKARRSFQWVKR
eukprot:TRINITY_DN27773_c0_g1_i1.p1 TRINITY_DN27773_c0_g1~~TRINITY_DN27773_c0_g1_i1.p1  ORF type:complete len:429 (-),score=106.87 TRINITY_DN27773_c0_g1_i1:172-1458(-)